MTRDERGMKEGAGAFLKGEKWKEIMALNAGDGAAGITAVTDAGSSLELEDSDVIADVTCGTHLS